MKNLTLIQTTFYTLGALIMTIICLIYGQFILIPLAYSVLFAMLFNPVVKRIKKVVKNHTLSYILTVLLSLIIVGVPLYFITGEIAQLFMELSGEEFGVDNIISKGKDILRDNGLYFPTIFEQFSSDLSGSFKWIGGMLGGILSGSSTFLIYIGLSIIFAYFLTTYYDEFKRILYGELERKDQRKWQAVIQTAPTIVRSYLGGMLLVMAILAVLNGIVLFIIGLKYAIVWALIIGLLAIIPYVGSFIGVMLPMVYSFVSTGDIKQPLTILVCYMVIQSLEGNFITPKVVGDKINVNPMILIILMLVFGKLWGVAGVIICLPLAGIIRVAMAQWDSSEFIAELMSSKGD